MLVLLLHTALRESEMLSLQYPKQYKDGYLHNIKRKGKKTTKKLKVPTPARAAIEEYFENDVDVHLARCFRPRTARSWLDLI